MLLKEVTLVRYGELALKSRQVRARFERRLLQNIRATLGRGAVVRAVYGRIVVDSGRDCGILKRVFGITSFSKCLLAGSDKGKILDAGLFLAKKKIMRGDSFAVKTSRVGEHSFSSNDINRELGALIVKELGNKVNLSCPDKSIFIDIRDKKSYIYTEITKGPGGLPLGSSGRVAVLMENEKSADAAIMMMKRGCETVPLFTGKPMPSWTNKIQKWSPGIEIKPLLVRKGSPEKLAGIILKTGSMGLVTSETLAGAKGFRRIKKNLPVPVHRPLISD